MLSAIPLHLPGLERFTGAAFLMRYVTWLMNQLHLEYEGS